MTSTGRTPRSGFTLIEIVSLVLLGILAATVFNFAGQAVRGFFISRDAMEITQKAQIAFNRMRAEFTYLTAVSASSAASITYTAEFSSGSEENTIAYDAAAGTITLDGGSQIEDVATAGGMVFHYFARTTARYGRYSPVRRTIIGVTLTKRDSDGPPCPHDRLYSVGV
jgi:type II secretory pathway pseudopilin PulG